MKTSRSVLKQKSCPPRQENLQWQSLWHCLVSHHLLRFFFCVTIWKEIHLFELCIRKLHVNHCTDSLYLKRLCNFLPLLLCCSYSYLRKDSSVILWSVTFCGARLLNHPLAWLSTIFVHQSIAEGLIWFWCTVIFLFAFLQAPNTLRVKHYYVK